MSTSVQVLHLKQHYPHITRAALEIAYDNGAIYRGRSESKCLEGVAAFVESIEQEIVKSFEVFLSPLPQHTLHTICCGEETEVKALLQNAPAWLDEFLNDLFDKI